MRQPDHELHAAVAGRPPHLVDLGQRQRRRLLAQHVLAAPGGQNRQLRMELRRDADGDNVDVRPVDGGQGVINGFGAGLVGQRPSALGVYIGHGHDSRLGHGPPGGSLYAPHGPRPNDSNVQRLHRSVPPSGGGP